MPVSRRSLDACRAAVLAAGLALLVACGQQAASPPDARAAEEAAIRAATAEWARAAEATIAPARQTSAFVPP